MEEARKEEEKRCRNTVESRFSLSAAEAYRARVQPPAVKSALKGRFLSPLITVPFSPSCLRRAKSAMERDERGGGEVRTGSASRPTPRGG